jgi:hypothetical protein
MFTGDGSKDQSAQEIDFEKKKKILNPLAENEKKKLI